MLIYKVTNIINNKVYIGQTVKTLSQRKSEHKHRFLYENSHNKFYNALKKYGWDNFTWEVIEESKDWTYEILDQKEKYYIQLYDSINMIIYGLKNKRYYRDVKWYGIKYYNK